MLSEAINWTSQSDEQIQPIWMESSIQPSIKVFFLYYKWNEAVTSPELGGLLVVLSETPPECACPG